MKLISKPIRKGSATEPKNITGAACIASVLLTGAVALTATGCTTEVKADGITVENLIVSGSEYTGEIIEGINSGSNMSVEAKAPNGVIKADPTGIPGTTNSGINPGNNGNQVRNTPVAGTGTGNNGGKTVDGNGNTVSGTNNGQGSTRELASFAKIPDGTVYEFEEDDNGIFEVKKDFGQIIIYMNGSNLEYGIDGYFYSAEMTSNNIYNAWLIRNNGKTFIYVDTDAYDYLNVYEITERSMKYLGSDRLVISGPSMNNTKSFKCYEYNGVAGETDVVSFVRNYKVSDNGMPVPADNYSELGAWIDVMASYDMTGYVVRNGSVTSDTRTIRKGDKVVPVKLNELEHIDFKTSDGEIVRVDFTSQFCNFFSENDNRWAYKAVMSMVEPYVKRVTVDDLADGMFIGSENVRTYSTELYAWGVDIRIEPYGGKEVKITYLDESYILDIKHDYTSDGIGACYLLKSNGRTFLYVTSFCENDQEYINVYEITTNNVSYVGSTRLSIDYIYTTDKIWGIEYDEMNGMISITRTYKVSDNGMPVISNNMCYVNVYGTLRAVHDIDGYIVKNGVVTSEKITIKAGEILEPLCFNEVEYIEFFDSEGHLIRADFTDELNTYYDMYDNNWVYKAVLSMVYDYGY